MATKQKDDAQLLTKTASQFNKLDESYMEAGDGGRYGLLIYKLLVEKGNQRMAGEVINKTITDLEKFTADTLNEARYADENILAYAYYLEYQADIGSDTAKAMEYLAKAALYSPLKASERAYASNYDRDFLQSKESYRDEYINKLFEHGDSEAALRIFADNVNASYDRLDEMQGIYESHFPGKSFRDFVAKNVIADWQDAPGFTLAGIDGKPHSLADYKGKWLVADFWGTWCSPCRREMPEVNAFNNEIAKGQHGNVVLLGIACRDDATSVKHFLADNNYGIPVVMGDDAIAKNYNIQGYPTKVIITPDGKMLQMAFGLNWSNIVDKFVALYKVN